MAAPLRVSAQFLDGTFGPLAVVIWEPAQEVRPHFAVVYVPPFADEMNKSRRMAALQARAFAAMGGTVALLDPRGTGDSGGDHGEATWDGWQSDVALTFAWLADRTGVTPMLWGLRLGGLLAAHLIARSCVSPSALVLWQPVTRGKAYCNQVLRLATVQQRVDGSSDSADAATLRAAIQAGKAVELAGYPIHPELLQSVEAIDLDVGTSVSCSIIWREVSSDESLLPISEQIARQWKARGCEIDIAAVAGPSFWITQEVEEAPSLIRATSEAVAHRCANNPSV